MEMPVTYFTEETTRYDSDVGSLKAREMYSPGLHVTVYFHNHHILLACLNTSFVNSSPFFRNSLNRPILINLPIISSSP
jgi:hypothetical protein